MTPHLGFTPAKLKKKTQAMGAIGGVMHVVIELAKVFEVAKEFKVEEADGQR